MRRALALLAASSLAACATPDTPDLRPTPNAWTEAADAGAPPAAEIADAWWRAYQDPLLAMLVEAAGEADDVEIARTRLDEARAGLKRARSALAPQIEGVATGFDRKNGDAGVFGRSRGAQPALQAIWDPDFFGASRTRSRAARASAESAAFDLAQARIDARAAAAQLYFSYRDAQARFAAAERTVASLTDALSLARSRVEAGLASNLDLAQARAALAAAEAQPAAASQAQTEARLGLERLLGLPPGALRAELEAPTPVPLAAPTHLLAPVEVLARRPDLRAAERRLAAAGYESSAARRDFFPKLTLSGLFGVQWVEPQTPFTANGGVWNVAGSLAAPILTFGQLEGARNAAEARLQRAAIEYRAAATAALTEVELALDAGSQASIRLAAQREALAAAREQAELARARYTAGLVPLLEVLTAEQAAFSAEAAASAAAADAAQAYATLSAAMGLGAARAARGSADHTAFLGNAHAIKPLSPLRRRAWRSPRRKWKPPRARMAKK